MIKNSSEGLVVDDKGRKVGGETTRHAVVQKRVIVMEMGMYGEKSIKRGKIYYTRLPILYEGLMLLGCSFYTKDSLLDIILYANTIPFQTLNKD